MNNSKLMMQKIIGFSDADKAVSHFKNSLNSDLSISIGYVNAYFLDLYKQGVIDQALLDSIAWLYRDGIAIKWFMKLKGYEPGYNANGTDLNPLLLNASVDAQNPIALIGDEAGVVQLMAEKIKAQGGEVVLFCDGFSSFDKYIISIGNLPPKTVIFLGMGMPRQEKLASEICRIYPDRGFKLISSGAFFKFYTNSIPRAPLWMRSLNIEWLYRLLREPSRMFDRYILGLFRMLSYLITEKTG